jgi:asparagine N-glycosylation enzyme membrane subunit Stt3
VAVAGVEALRRRLARTTWVQRALCFGFLLALVWTEWHTRGLPARVGKDLLVYLAAPATFAALHGRHLGWRVDRVALRNTALLALLVLPFYLVGSSLPSVREFYPMWGGTKANFLAHSVQQFLVVIAAETYYRGLLCVGVRDLGRKAVFISPVIYTFHHLGKPPIELALSGPTDALFGLVDYESDSILPSVVAHGLGLTLLDWLVLHDPVLPPETVLSWLRWLPIPL